MITPRLRFSLKLKMWFQQLGTCYWCQRDLHFGKIDKNDRTFATIDHLKTKNQGRETYMEGGHVLACRSCNAERNRQELYEMGRITGRKVRQLEVDRIWNAAVSSKKS